MDFLSQLEIYVPLVKDIVSVISTILLAIIAVISVQTWKRQLSGKTEYEASRRLLRSVYKVREAIKAVRNPYISAAESSQAIQAADIEYDPNESDALYKRTAAVYQRRWKLVSDAMEEFEIEAFEAEVIWGDEIRNLLSSLRRQVSNLLTNIESYLRNLQQPPERQPKPENRIKIEKTIYGLDDFLVPAKDNPFSQKTFEIIQGIEEFLRPRIKL